MRSNSRGIVVSHIPIGQAIEDLKMYVWENWNGFVRDRSDRVYIIYEIPYRELSGADAAIPLQVSLIEKSWHSADYDPDAHAINIELGVEDLAKFAQYFNPNREHPRWADLKDHLTQILVHEITHAMEFRAEISKQTNRYDARMLDLCGDDDGPECEGIRTQYFNTPVEVSAMTNEIVYQIIVSSGDALPSRVEDALDLSIRWQEIEPYLTKKNKNLIRKRVYTRLYTGDLQMRKNPMTTVADLRHLIESSPLSDDEAFETAQSNYAESFSDPDGYLEDRPVSADYRHMHGRNYIFVGPKGRLLKVYAEDLQPVQGNVFYADKLKGLAVAPKFVDFKIPLHVGFVDPWEMDDQMYQEAVDYEDDFYEPDEDDIGEVFFKLRDGNHRTLGALLSGEPYAYVQISNSMNQDYKEWVAAGRPDNWPWTSLTVLTYLDENLE